MQYRVQNVFLYNKTIVETWQSTHVIFHLVKKPSAMQSKLLQKILVSRLYKYKSLDHQMLKNNLNFTWLMDSKEFVEHGYMDIRYIERPNIVCGQVICKNMFSLARTN